jgi:hypothetical protein
MLCIVEYARPSRSGDGTSAHSGSNQQELIYRFRFLLNQGRGVLSFDIIAFAENYTACF